MKLCKKCQVHATSVAVGWLRALLLLTIMSIFACTSAEETDGAADAFAALAREQSLAESYAVLLDTMGKQDLSQYARGIAMYANAKADFDALIERMKYNLINQQPFDKDAKFDAILATAVERRVAFTEYVAEIVETSGPGAKPGLAAIGAVATLVPVLTAAAKEIWTEYQKLQDDRRQQILTQLNSLKWQPYHKFGGVR